MPSRRQFLATAAASAAASSLPAATPNPQSPNPLPRWRGFNLLPFFSSFDRSGEANSMVIPADDLRLIRDLGFDYVRLPIDYWLFVDSDWAQTRQMDPAHVTRVRASALDKLDALVAQCRASGLHLTLNLHRAPGYCINGWEHEPYNLFKDPDAEDAFAFYWDLFARRYASEPASTLSFNLVNEAPNPGEKMSTGDYRRVMKRAGDAIRAVSPDRLVIVDGIRVGREVSTNLIQEGYAQAVHAYDPHPLTHYKAGWVRGSDQYPVPQWPYVTADGVIQDRRFLEIYFAPWAALARSGVGVHCGECGCYTHTAHDVFLRWFEEVLAILKENAIGWSLWNFRGDFGILDSHRPDVAYQPFHGHLLDRRLLDLLLRF